MLFNAALLFHQTQISTEVIDDEYKYSLPRRGSPFRGLGRGSDMIGLEPVV